ncbi:MAG: ABC transporter permease [Planctomycetota bacterium]|jgi:rhamnose transport system permease protein
MRKWKTLFARLAGTREIGIVVILALVVLAISVRNPTFLSADNLYDIAVGSAILAIVAVGTMMVILTGGIDISVGSGMVLSGMVVALVIKDHWGIPPLVALALGTLIGAVLGSVNGLLVVKGGIPPIITTLGTMSLFRGVTFVICYTVNKGKWVSADKYSPAFKDFTRTGLLGVPNLILIAVIVYAVFYYVLRHTMTGRKIYAVGGNPRAARLVGINVGWITFLPYLLAGMLFGMGGVLWISRYASAEAGSAMGFEFMAITAVVLGGVSIAGGSGSILGVLLGSILIGVISNALNLALISEFWEKAINGFVILLAVIVGTVVSRRADSAAAGGGGH